MKKIFALALLALSLLVPETARATAKFLVLCTTACTWDNTNDTIWSLSSGGINNTTHPTSADTATLDASSCVGGVTCTITVAANLAVQSIAMGTCTASTTGCILDFSANNNNVTVTTNVSLSGTGTRQFKCGTGTFTLNGSNTNVWDISTNTNLTLTCTGATIIVGNVGNANPQNFVGGTQTYGTLQINSRTTGALVAITGTNTFTNLTFNGQGAMTFPNGVTTTVTTLSLQGSSTSAPLLFYTNVTSPATILATAATVTNAGLRGITFTNLTNATSSFDFGGNTGVTITPPSGGGSGGKIIGG